MKDVDVTRNMESNNFKEMYDQLKIDEIYVSNSQRYEHELNKIRFVFVAVRKLKDLAASIQ